MIPAHLRYLPIFNTGPAEQPGCAHLAAMRTARGGFRGVCGHPDGSPLTWAGQQQTLVGRRVRITPQISPQGQALAQ